MRPALVLTTLALSLVALPSALADGVGDISMILDLDPTVGENPEGVAVDKKGNVFVSVAPTGELLKIDPKGDVSTHATFNPGFGFLLGMTVDAPGNVFVALGSFDANTGVYKVTPGGDVSKVAAMGADTFPNDLAFDKKGNLYVTESIAGAVYRIAPGSGEAELWFQDELLFGDPEISPVPFPIGANGIAVDKHSIIVANSQVPRLVRIPIDKDGDPGDPEVIVEDPLLMGADGIALDVHRDIYVACNAGNLLLKVHHCDGEIEVLADESDGLDFPATIAFGQGPAGKKNLYITNFALFSGPTGNPGILKASVGVAGLAVP
ncbi:MAG: SMP-30/gluconolactonase/LRE family protein [Myxococcales bacterium]|nr:SMP-30/gluconolactonase/LRE family protein [Myxococcales bacterium]